MLLGIILIGLIFLLLGLAVVAQPGRLRHWLHRFLRANWLPMLSLLRILVGGVLIIWSGETNAPALMMALGLLLLFAGVILPLLGESRVEAMAQWWLRRDDRWMRGWGVAVALIGAAIAWAGS
jgi:ABC-type transport system involved in multi-copper enzyme maturation permease subunit